MAYGPTSTPLPADGFERIEVRDKKYDPMLQCVPAGQGCEYHIGYSKYEDEPKLYYELINYNYFDTSLLIFDDFNHKKLLDKYITENNIKKNTDKQVCLLKQYNYLH